MADKTEGIRRFMQSMINVAKMNRQELEAKYGKVWSTGEVTAEFEVLLFMAPYVAVKRKSDGVVGSLLFQHEPRFYFCFVPDSERGE